MTRFHWFISELTIFCVSRFLIHRSCVCVMYTAFFRPVDFKLRYEFVDLQQDGTAMGQDNECHRKFVSNQLDKKEPIVFRSSRNIFLFGRGGATSLKYVHCATNQPTNHQFVVCRWVMEWRRHSLTHPQWCCYCIARFFFLSTDVYIASKRSVTNAFESLFVACTHEHGNVCRASTATQSDRIVLVTPVPKSKYAPFCIRSMCQCGIWKRLLSNTVRSHIYFQIMEQPWYNTTTFLRGCGCNSMNTSDLPIIYTSSSREIEIHFTAVNMTTEDDPDNLHFEATYEFIKGPMACKELRKVAGGSGSISVSTDDVSQWVSWLMPPRTHTHILPILLVLVH